MIDWMVLYALPLFIVVVALETKALNMVGAVSGLLMAYLILLTQGFYWFLVMFAFLVLGMLATKFKEEKKAQFKLKQKRRGSKNIMANGGVGLLMALLGGPAGMYGFIGAISTALSDTVSSEVGTALRSKPIMITNFKPAKPGINGAISVNGTLAGLGAAFLLGLIALPIMFSWKTLFIATVAGILGNLFDSLFGALFENRKWWGNSTTNMLATVVGAIIAMVLGVIL